MSRELLAFIGLIALRVTFVLVVAGIMALILRRASAALRHWVWVLAMCAALMMPALVMIAPHWNVELPRTPTTPNTRTNNGIVVNPIARPTVNPIRLTINQNESAPQVTTASNEPADLPQPTITPQPKASTPTARFALRVTWSDFTTVLLAIWAIGAVSILAMGTRHYGKIQRVTAPALELPQDITQTAIEIRQTLSIRRPVRLVMTPAINIPMTIGVWRPVIVLPAEAANWDAERRRVVLLHESIHIARWDALHGWLSLLVVALHWFNPLAWIATRRLAIESETACDDRVLQLGTPGPDYAAHLVAIAQNLLGNLRHQSITPGLAQMTQVGNLSGRVHAILDKQRRRGTTRWQQMIGLLLVLSLITPIATIVGSNTTAIAKPHRASANENITLTVAIPEDLMSSIGSYTVNSEDLLLDEFEATHPGVKVVLRRDDSGWLDTPLAANAQDYLDSMVDFADGADVLMTRTVDYVTPMATQAGLFLDLAPLAAADPDFDQTRYFPAALQSLQWNNGLWALPLAQTPVFVTYNREAFDAAGLTYPDESWTMDQYVAAAIALTTDDGNGRHIAGLAGDPTYLFRALLGRPFYHMTDPAQPSDFASDTELMALAEQWIELAKAEQAAWMSDYNALSPIQINASWAVNGDYKTADDDASWATTLLPGGTAGLESVTSLVVSAGTQAPELAYELAMFLSLSDVFVTVTPGLMGSLSALLQPGSTLDYPEVNFSQGTTEAQNTADLLAAQHAIPSSERVFVNYVSTALINSWVDGTDLMANLQQGDDMLRDAFALADQMRPTIVLNIPPALPPVEVPPGQVAVQFHMMNTTDNIYNFEQWQQAAADFAAQDDEVFSVELLTGWSFEEGQPVDCFLSTDDFVPDLLNLEPLMSADPEFDTNDFNPAILDRVRREGQIVGYPLALIPAVIWVDQAVVESTGINLSTKDWDITAFVETLTSLKDSGQVSSGMMLSYGGTDVQLLLLMAAYGALPIDYRTNPATVDLTSPTHVEAIGRVLDLVKNRYIADPDRTDIDYDTIPMSAGEYYDFSLNLDPTYGPPKAIMNYPSGREYTPVTYEVQSGYIYQSAQNVEACYRWLRYVAGRPELSLGIPARRSALDSPVLDSAFGPDIAESFRSFYAHLDAPNTLQIPDGWYSNEQLDTAIGMWIQEAFASYLDNKSDLESALTLAQERTDTYMTCMVDAPVLSPTATLEEYEHWEDFRKSCALGADPDVMSKDPFSYIYSSD